MSIYETWAYEVRANESGVGYHLYNKVTGVNEGGSERLPSIISQCDVSTELLNEIAAKLIARRKS